MNKTSGEGAASDAAVSSVMTDDEQTAADLEAGRLAGEAERRASAARKVKAAGIMLEKALASVAGAEDALAQAKAEQEGLD